MVTAIAAFAVQSILSFSLEAGPLFFPWLMAYTLPLALLSIYVVLWYADRLGTTRDSSLVRSETKGVKRKGIVLVVAVAAVGVQLVLSASVNPDAGPFFFPWLMAYTLSFAFFTIYAALWYAGRSRIARDVLAVGSADETGGPRPR